MKKFDIELAKAGAPVCTRDGKPARIICWDVKNKKYQIAGLIGEREGEWVDMYTEDGKYDIEVL